MQRRLFLSHSAALAVAMQAGPASSAAAPGPLTIVHGSQLSAGWRFGVKDLKKYLTLAGTAPAVRTLAPGQALPKGTLVVLFDAGDKALAALRARFPASPRGERPDSFSISSHARPDAPGQLVYFLEAADAMGEQFCCYDFLERYAGVRFLHPDFEHTPKLSAQPGRIDTALAAPAFTYRGLYPWNYNYDRRGLDTFCDINARFEAGDWAWFARLGDWLIKNKQNTLFWFDDVFGGEALSKRFPPTLKDYWRERGLLQVLGVGWPSNEGRPRGGKWEALTCVNAHGRSIEKAAWRKAICPQVPEYYTLAEKNFEGIDFKASNAIGALIGYGENTWAAHQTSECHRHATISGDTLMVRDLQYVTKKVAGLGAPQLPLGFVISTHAATPDSPFIVGSVIKNLPANGIVSIHIYQQDTWKRFSGVLDQIRQRNAGENAQIKAVQIAEVAFLCNYDIPLFRPSILRRREAHFRSVPREDTAGHLTTLNTTQYLYWLKSYQLMRWQWHQSSRSWGEEMAALGADLFGAANGRLFAELVGRFAALDLLQPASTRDELLRTSTQLERITAWARYTPASHSDEFGFFLWAKNQSAELLDDAAQNVRECLQLNAQLVAASGPLYRSQFFDTLALTAHYHAIRIHCGKADQAMAAARSCGQGAQCTALVQRAIAELGKMKASLRHYDALFARLLRQPGRGAPPKSPAVDFVFNPSSAFIDRKTALLKHALANKLAPAGLFDPA